MWRHLRHTRRASWACHAAALSVGLHAIVIGGAWWASGGLSSSPPEARFADGEQPLVVTLQLVERRDADGVHLSYTATPPMPTPDETRVGPPPMPDTVQLTREQPPAETSPPPTPPVVELAPIEFEAPIVKAAPPDAPPPPARSTGVKTEPSPIDMPPLRYPPPSRRRGETGTVILEALVKPDGSVTGIRVIQSPGYPLLVQAARDALSGARFRPATHSGNPVACTVRVPFTFQLKR